MEAVLPLLVLVIPAFAGMTIGSNSENPIHRTG